MSDFMKILGYGWLQRKKGKKTLPPPQYFKIACLLLVWQAGTVIHLMIITI